MMAASPPPPSYQVYLDSTVLIDLAHSGQPRHAQANALLAVFRKHRNSRALQLMTSAWTVAEAQGVLYGILLKEKGVSPPYQNIHVRNIMPPRVSELNQAKNQLDNVIKDLMVTTDFSFWRDSGSSASQIWPLVVQLGQEAAIWPADSVHLSIALYSGCSMMVSDDRDFLDKIDYCATLIKSFRQNEFSQLGNTPEFEACGVDQSARTISPSPANRRRLSAIQRLQKNGFR